MGEGVKGGEGGGGGCWVSILLVVSALAPYKGDLRAIVVMLNLI